MIIKFIIIISGLSIFFIVGGFIPFSDQKEILEALSTSSSIIFAILGIWIAILYPNNFAKTIKKDNHYIETDIIFQKLTFSLVLTTLILISIIFSHISMYIFKNIPFFLSYKETLRSLFFIYLCSISIVQAYAILTSLIPSNYFYSFSSVKKRQSEFANRSGPLKK